MPVSVRTRVRQNSTSTSDTILDVNRHVWTVMAMGYIEACQLLSWCQSFDPGPNAWTWSGWRRYGSPSDETEPTSLGPGDTEHEPKGSCETEPAVLRSGETGPVALGSGETI